MQIQFESSQVTGTTVRTTGLTLHTSNIGNQILTESEDSTHQDDLIQDIITLNIMTNVTLLRIRVQAAHFAGSHQT